MAERARDGFQRGVVTGLIGMGLTGLTGGRLSCAAGRCRRTGGCRRSRSITRAGSRPRRSPGCARSAQPRASPLHDALMDRVGWPAIPFDGKLLVSHQDALLMGGKVQAPAGYADHVVFVDPGALRAMRRADLHRRLFRPGDHARARTACPRSTAKNASTAAPACGTARSRARAIRSGPTSNFAPAPAACIRRRTDGQQRVAAACVSSARGARPPWLRRIRRDGSATAPPPPPPRRAARFQYAVLGGKMTCRAVRAMI